MLGIQNTLPVTNPVKFGQSVDSAEIDEHNYQVLDQEPDEFEREEVRGGYSQPASKEDIEAERDKKVADIEKTQSDMNELAENLEKNNGKVAKGAGKAVRFFAGALGLATAFVTAKYGAKISIGILRGVFKSQVAKDAINGGKSALGPIGKGLKNIGKAWTKFVSNPLITEFKKSATGKKLAEFAQKPMIKNAIEKVQGYKEATKVLVKSMNGEKVQSAVENTLAASTTASVLIDDLSGRNENKSNLDLVLGSSGGDK